MSDHSLGDEDPCVEHGSFHLGTRDGGSRAESAPPAGPRRLAGVSAPPAWWPDRFEAFLGSCASVLLERLGEGNVKAILLSGSFSLDEGSVLFTDGGPLILSDVDLVLVAATRDAFTAAYRCRSELGAACESRFPEAIFSGRVEIGVLLVSQLPHLAARPGVFDMKRYGRVVWGDGGVLELVPSFRAQEVSAGEALTLIENRMAAFLGSYPAHGRFEGSAHAFNYSIARVYTDIATAILCILGRYRPGYAGRSRALQEGAGGADRGRLPAADLSGRITGWTRFKLQPSGEPPGGDARAPIERWGEAARDIFAFWKREAAVSSGVVGNSASPRSLSVLLRARAKSAGPRHNLRFWKWYLARMPLGERVRTAAALRFRLLESDPSALIREHVIRLVDHWVRHGPDGRIGSRCYPLVPGARHWREAAVRVHELWVEVVFGRKGDR